MKYLSVIFTITIFIFGCCSAGRVKDKSKIDRFNEFLGSKKAVILDGMVESFNDFLNKNYSSQENLASQTQQFLKDLLKNDCEPQPFWEFNTKENLKLFNEFEKSGLRKEIYLYHYELDTDEFSKSEFSIYDIIKKAESQQENLNLGSLMDLDTLLLDIGIPINEITKEDSIANVEREKEMQNRRDSSLVINLNGRFLYGLAKFRGVDSAGYRYVEAIVRGGALSPLLITHWLLTNFPLESLEDPFIKRIIAVELYYFLMRYDLTAHENL